MTTKTIQMTIDAEMLAEVDRATADLDLSRSALIRAALVEYLRQVRTGQLERQHADGYARAPQQLEEVQVWAAEQVWGDP